jgi:hypothetical protein
VNENEPQSEPAEPAIQMTPVEFGPTETEEQAIGTIPPAPRQPTLYSSFWPILILLVVLIYSSVRDVITLNRHIVEINVDEASAMEMLKGQNRQTDFVEAMRANLQALSATDPAAAQICSEYYPSAPSQKSAAPVNSSKTPGQ